LTILCLCAAARSQEAADSLPWHQKNAVLRFRVEKDDTQSLIPNVSLLDVEPDKKSENVKKWIEKNRWDQKPRVEGELCQNFLPSFGSGPIVYNLHKDFTHFVARAAIVDGADPNTAVNFEVYADKRLIFRSGPLTPQQPLAEINAGIPVRSKQLLLATSSPDDKYLGWAKWVDPGFMVRGGYPKVSTVRIYAPGYNLEDFVPQVFAPSSGSKVRSRIVSVGRGEPMDVLFESLDGYPSYLVYLVPKDKATESNESWEPQAGLVLETRWTKKSPGSSGNVADLLKLFHGSAEPVGRSLVETIHHAFAIHRVPEYSDASSRQGGIGLYYYKGFFAVDKSGPYSFATISQDDSYLSVDDKLVVSWPGRHDINAGRRGEKQGTVSLEPGVHKLEYLHFSPWPNMFAAAAWEKPGEELRIMTRTDFVPIGRYKIASAGFEDPNKAYAVFEWSAADDFRLEQTGRSFVAMRFEFVQPNPLARYDCRWTFDDGTAATGERVEHVFLRPGLRSVQLEVRLDDKLLARASQEVYVHPAWDKPLTSASNVEPFNQAIRQRNLDKVPPDDLVNLFILAEDANRPGWKSRATAALAENPGRLVQESGDTDFIFEFGQYLQSPQLKKYDKALELFSRLARKSGVDQPIVRRVAICQAEVLTEYFGRNDEALKILNQFQIDTASRDDLTWRAIMAKAQAMLAIGQAKEAIDLVQALSAPSNPSDKAKQQIKHAGLMRHARVLTQSKNDPNQLDYAMANIETVLAEDPVQIFSPGVNLVKLDVHLVRGEFQAAFHLTERLKNLQLSDYDIAEVLARQVIASCGLKDVQKAKSVYAQLSKDYPSSPATDQAKKAIIQALGQPFGTADERR
jgi:tetratricopeptide (TPR) repeat protein